jgi:hypothetical protein
VFAFTLKQEVNNYTVLDVSARLRPQAPRKNEGIQPRASRLATRAIESDAGRVTTAALRS